MPEKECYTREELSMAWFNSLTNKYSFNEWINTLHQKSTEEVFNIIDIQFNLVLMELEYDND